MKRLFNPKVAKGLVMFSGATYATLYATGQLENAYYLSGGLFRAARAMVYGVAITINYFKVIIF